MPQKLFSFDKIVFSIQAPHTLKALFSKLQIKVSERVYLKDPESTDLGKRIVRQGIVLIDKIGLEQFTFKKLAQEIGSTEASVYRYFENKHKFLIYLLSIYWNWVEYLFVFRTTNLACPKARLEIAIDTLVRPLELQGQDLDMDLQALYRIVVAESAKAYLTKEVDMDDKEGFFASYKQLVNRIAEIVSEIRPDYRYAHALIAMVIETAHHQSFFSEHIPVLTEVEKNKPESVIVFLKEIVFKTLA